MGIFGMIGKMAGSKVVETVENELTKMSVHLDAAAHRAGRLEKD